MSSVVLVPVAWAIMLRDVIWLLVMLVYLNLEGASCYNTSEELPLERQPRSSGEIVPGYGLVQGDIALPEELDSADEDVALAYVNNQAALTVQLEHHKFIWRWMK